MSTAESTETMKPAHHAAGTERSQDTEHTATAYEVRPIPSAALAELRVEDDAGAPPRRTVDTQGGNPLRCCMGRSEPGESLVLVSYAPLRRWARETGADPGAYDEMGPVFIHSHDCGGWAGAPDGCFPDAMRGERRVLRAYSAQGRILGGTLLDRRGGTAPTVEEGLAELYTDPRVATVHVRAVEFDCFLAGTRRTGSRRAGTDSKGPGRYGQPRGQGGTGGSPPHTLPHAVAHPSPGSEPPHSARSPHTALRPARTAPGRGLDSPTRTA